MFTLATGKLDIERVITLDLSQSGAFGVIKLTADGRTIGEFYTNPDRFYIHKSCLHDMGIKFLTSY